MCPEESLGRGHGLAGQAGGCYTYSSVTATNAGTVEPVPNPWFASRPAVSA